MSPPDAVKQVLRVPPTQRTQDVRPGTLMQRVAKRTKEQQVARETCVARIRSRAAATHAGP